MTDNVPVTKKKSCEHWKIIFKSVKALPLGGKIMMARLRLWMMICQNLFDHTSRAE